MARAARSAFSQRIRRVRVVDDHRERLAGAHASKRPGTPSVPASPSCDGRGRQAERQRGGGGGQGVLDVEARRQTQRDGLAPRPRRGAFSVNAEPSARSSSVGDAPCGRRPVVPASARRTSKVVAVGGAHSAASRRPNSSPTLMTATAPGWRLVRQEQTPFGAK